ncbi:MAG: energy transducer TonB [Rhizobiaceae bacterium]
MSAAAHTGSWPAVTGPEIARWSLAAAVVIAAHLTVAYTIGAMVKEPRPAADEALTVDLTPFIMTQAEQEQPDVLQEETTEPILEEVQQEEIAEEAEETPATETPPDEQPVEVETEVAEVQTETVDPDQPDLVTETIETPPAEVVVPKPVKKPVKKVEKKPPKVVKKPAPKKVTATEPAKGKNRTTQSEATAARAPSVSPARWHSQVYAAIARRKPRDRGVNGRVSIRFVVSSSGSIVSAGIARSSGNSALDSAALAMVRGARVPAPPPGLPGSRHPFTVPVVFQ